MNVSSAVNFELDEFRELTLIEMPYMKCQREGKQEGKWFEVERNDGL